MSKLEPETELDHTPTSMANQAQFLSVFLSDIYLRMWWEVLKIGALETPQNTYFRTLHLVNDFTGSFYW